MAEAGGIAQEARDHDGGQRRPGRPREARHDKAILDAVIKILGQKGYAGLTIDGVAAMAAVSRPTVYRRWSSKPALVIAALAHSTGLAPAPDTGTLAEDLLAFQRDQVALMNSPDSRRTTAGLVADLVADPELAAAYLGEFVGPRRESVWGALRRGIERGELRSDVDFAFISDLLIGPLFMRSVVRGEPLEPEIAEDTVDIVLKVFGNTRTKRRGSRSPVPHGDRRSRGR